MASRNTSSSTSSKTSQNKTASKLTAYQKEQIETLKKINEFKLAAEASAIAILYKNPEKVSETTLTLEDITNDCWKIFFAIAYGVVVTEGKGSLSEVNINFYLDKHPKLSKRFEEFGGYDTISGAMSYVDDSKLDSYVEEIKKWNAVIKLLKMGFPVSDNLKNYVDMDAEEIYQELEGYLNHIFSNVDTEIKTYNALSGLHELVDKRNAGQQNGLPFTLDLLNKEIGGLRLGNIYGLIGTSGSGKSTLVMNCILPTIIEKNERCCIIINEQDQEKVQEELLLYCCQYILKKPIKKVQLRDGNFDKETLETLHKAADWLEAQDKNHNITVIPLERYTIGTTLKLIKKYKNLFGVNYFIIDTLKESSDSNDEIWRSLQRDSVALYDLCKPSNLNVCLVVTLQTAKSSIKNRHLRISDIGQSKSVVDVFSCAILFRRAEPDEYRDEKKELKCFRLEGKNTKVQFYLKPDKYYLIFFIGKNRFGETDKYSIVTEINYSTNQFEDVGYCIVPEEW